MGVADDYMKIFFNKNEKKYLIFTNFSSNMIKEQGKKLLILQRRCKGISLSVSELDRTRTLVTKSSLGPRRVGTAKRLNVTTALSFGIELKKLCHEHAISD